MSGPVTTANSLVGTSVGDYVGSEVTVLKNGNYVVSSSGWDFGAVADAGVATLGSGVAGVVGPVTAANSLHGATAGDRVSSYGVTALANGNYVVNSPNWDNGLATDAGAATFGNDVIADLDEAGVLCVYTSAATHVTVDVTSYLS